MRQFFKFLFASCLGSALGIGLLFFMGVSLLVGMAGAMGDGEKVTVSENSVLELKFDQLIPEKTNNTELDPFDPEQKYVVGLNDMVKMIAKAKEDPDIKGIYLNADVVSAGKATQSEIRDALLDFKQSGKFVYAYAHYYTQNAYYLASAADSVWINPVGLVDFKGYGSTVMFYKNMLDKLDVQMRIFYAGQFKGATEPYRLDKMSDANRLQVRVYLNALNDIMMRDVAASRQIPESDLRAIADNYGGHSAESALQNRLVDRIMHEDQAFESMKQKIGLAAKDKLKRVDMADYYAAKGKKTDFSVKDKIAVVFAEGQISDGAGGAPGTVMDGEYVKMLRKIRKDEHIKAVVLRINSPGGSVLASENIYREVMLCKAAGKPVVVSMGDVAASGGYYIACPADSIFAEPGTLTGSIGVFGAIPILQNTFKNKLGITVDTVKTGKYSTFGTPLIDFSSEESQMLQSRIDATYEDFLSKVAAGRKLTRDQVHEIAQGRVWAGAKAKEIGLVDDLGGLDRALSAAAKLANLEKYRTAEYPTTKTGMEQFVEQFAKKKDRDAMIREQTMQAELGIYYPVFKVMNQLRESGGLQARLPFEIIVD